MCVNALSRAILISTEDRQDAIEKLCECVNALSRAILISTDGQHTMPQTREDCVNALSRAILISTQCGPRRRTSQQVSMPSVGRSSFLLKPTTEDILPARILLRTLKAMSEKNGEMSNLTALSKAEHILSNPLKAHLHAIYTLVNGLFLIKKTTPFIIERGGGGLSPSC